MWLKGEQVWGYTTMNAVGMPVSCPSITHVIAYDFAMREKIATLMNSGSDIKSAFEAAIKDNDLGTLKFTATPSTPWTHGDHITVGGFAFHWDGTAWAAGAAPAIDKGAAAPGDAFPAEAGVNAEDAPNAAKLAGANFVANPTTAWTTGQSITVGTYAFHWDGSAWAAGAAA